MEERRRHQRITVEGVHGNIVFSSPVKVLNISLGGAAIETIRSLILVHYDIGVEFLKIDAEDRIRLEAFIHSIPAGAVTET
ncbi:MAG: hypothetical protein HY754_09325 [Nitrospirae bacterium]|nr:hypothetical protein [Nitrospirota bacterium]